MIDCKECGKPTAWPSGLCAACAPPREHCSVFGWRDGQLAERILDSPQPPEALVPITDAYVADGDFVGAFVLDYQGRIVYRAGEAVLR